MHAVCLLRSIAQIPSSFTLCQKPETLSKISCAEKLVSLAGKGYRQVRRSLILGILQYHPYTPPSYIYTWPTLLSISLILSRAELLLKVLGSMRCLFGLELFDPALKLQLRPAEAGCFPLCLVFRVSSYVGQQHIVKVS
jgi:hypothetical protein